MSVHVLTHTTDSGHYAPLPEQVPVADKAVNGPAEVRGHARLAAELDVMPCARQRLGSAPFTPIYESLYISSWLRYNRLAP